jgi:transposase
VSQYIGIDLHKAKSFVTRLNSRGRVLEQVEVPHANGALQDYLTQLPADARIVVEATGNWMWLYELIEERHPDLVLAHPLKTKAIASARIKTDKIDATTLAQLLRADLVSAAYIPPRDVRDTREILRYRASLVRLRTQVKNKIAAIVSKTGLQTPTRTTCGVKSQRFLATAPVRPCYRLELDGYRRTLTQLTTEIRHVSSTIESQAAADPQTQLLQTMPGIGAYSALLILSEIGDIQRFPDSRHLCSYAGLVPSVHASGGKTRLGRLTKQGSSWLRWILVELSVHAINGAPQFRSLYYRVAKKHGRNVGRVAVARAMLKTIYAMLTKQEVFRPMAKALPGQRPGVMARSLSR